MSPWQELSHITADVLTQPNFSEPSSLQQIIALRPAGAWRCGGSAGRRGFFREEYMVVWGKRDDHGGRGNEYL